MTLISLNLKFFCPNDICSCGHEFKHHVTGFGCLEIDCSDSPEFCHCTEFVFRRYDVPRRIKP